MENPCKKMAAKVDPFDSLPDDVITLIVTRLPFKDAARASALGHRWRSRYLQHRRIDLDESFFTLGDKRQRCEADGLLHMARGLKITGQRHFVKFASRFTARYAEPKVESLRLAFSAAWKYADQVKGWVRTMASRGLEELELDFSDPEAHDADDDRCVDLPDEVYLLRQTLRTLALARCTVKPGSFGDLHALRILSLSRTAVPGEAMQQLIAACPLVEELYLDRVTDMDVITVTSINRSLRVLHISDCETMEQGVRILMAPALQSFKYSGIVAIFEVQLAAPLEEVELDFPGSDAPDGCEIFRKLLVDLAMAERLTVSSNILQVLPFSGNRQHLSSLVDKLMHLTLNGVTLNKDEIPGIVILMRTYISLESLTVILAPRRIRSSVWPIPINQDDQYALFSGLDCPTVWTKHLDKPMPCLKVLKYLNVDGFTGQISQMDFIEFILMAGTSLVEVNITISSMPSLYGQTFQQRRSMANRMRHYPTVAQGVKITIK